MARTMMTRERRLICRSDTPIRMITRVFVEHRRGSALPCPPPARSGLGLSVHFDAQLDACCSPSALLPSFPSSQSSHLTSNDPFGAL